MRGGLVSLLVAAAHLGIAGVGPAVAQSAGGDMEAFALREHAGEAGPVAYRLHEPARWQAPRRLLVFLHGCTQDAADLAAGTGMNEVADAGGFAVLYPQQDPALHPQRCWVWYDEAQQSAEGTEVRRLQGLAESVAAELEVEPGRLYLAGISAGAAMANILGVIHPESYAGLGLHSGVPFGVAEDAMGALSVMQQGPGALPDPETDPRMADVRDAALPDRVVVIHGLADPVVHPDNGAALARQWVGIFEARLGAPLEGGEDDVRTGPRAVHDRRWQDAEGHGRVAHLAVEELGHAWSGGSEAGSYADPEGPPASRLLATALGLLR